MSPVYLFYPNLIGYLRILSAIGAFAVATTSPYIFFILYAVSQILDAFDGHAARYFNQSTRFGAVLDMVTDRASTACLWVTLAQLYPDYALAFQGMLALDIMSHFARLVATTGKSHKDVSSTKNIFLKHYYGNKYILFTLCAGHEGAFMLLYFLAMLPKINDPTDGMAHKIAVYMLYISLPLCAIKEWMNAVQFWQSMVDIVEVDMQERKAAGLDKPAKATSPKSPKKSPGRPKASGMASPKSPRSSNRKKE